MSFGINICISFSLKIYNKIFLFRYRKLFTHPINKYKVVKLCKENDTFNFKYILENVKEAKKRWI